MDRCSRWGEQERDREEIFLGSHHFLLIMKHTPPPLDLPALAVRSIRKTEKLSDGVTVVSGTEGVSHDSVKQIMLQSLMSRWKLILALIHRPSYSPRIGHWRAECSEEEDCEPFSSICCEFQRFFHGVSCSVACGHCSPRSEEFQEATMNSGIKCPEAG